MLFDAIVRQEGYLYALGIKAPPSIAVSAAIRQKFGGDSALIRQQFVENAAAIRQQFSGNLVAIWRKSSAITRIQFGSAELLRISRSHDGILAILSGNIGLSGGDRADIVQCCVDIRRAANICMVAGKQGIDLRGCRNNVSRET